MLYIKRITINNILCTLLCTRVSGYICLQGFHGVVGCLCSGGGGIGMGAGHQPQELIGSAVEIHLHFMVNYYYDIIKIIFFNGLHYYW